MRQITCGMRVQLVSLPTSLLHGSCTFSTQTPRMKNTSCGVMDAATRTETCYYAIVHNAIERRLRDRDRVWLSMLQWSGELTPIPGHTMEGMWSTVSSWTSAKWTSAILAIQKCMTPSMCMDIRCNLLKLDLLHLCPLSLFCFLIPSICLSLRYSMDGTMENETVHSDNWEPYPSPSLRKKISAYTSSQTIKELRRVLPKDFHAFYDGLNYEWCSSPAGITHVHTHSAPRPNWLQFYLGLYVLIKISSTVF